MQGKWPVVRGNTLQLPEDHPGFADPEYRRRRAAIAELAQSHRDDEPIPEAHYTADEDAVWREVSSQLAQLHDVYACDEFNDARSRLHLPADRVPQLREVDAELSRLTGFRIDPVPGLVPTRTFYGALARRHFLSTQYIRHHSVPFYTPEPDIVHEIIGHANMLASPTFASLYELAGAASLRAVSDTSLQFFSRVFWFTIEFGLVWERGELRTYGAGLLSSYGEIQAFRHAEARPFDLAQMGTLDYDITHYQPVLFAAPSFGWLVDTLASFFAEFDDETAASFSPLCRGPLGPCRGGGA
jgi:phenylalanine-4-hydroxylase